MLGPDNAPQYRDEDDDDTLVNHSRSDSKASGELPPEGEIGQKKRRGTTATLRRARANTVGTLAPILAAPTAASPTEPTPPAIAIPLGTQSIMGTLVESDMLALEVEVSEGRWILDGQVLRWWYDVPGEGESDKVLMLRIRRRGGPIKGTMRGFGGMDAAASMRTSYIPLDNEKPDRTVNILQACLLHAPTSLGKRNVCNNILSCRSRATGEVDSSMLRNEADKYWNGVMAPMIAHGGRTPQVSSHLSRFSEHADALANEAMLQTTYRDQRTLKANALIRDRYRSVMGGAIDTRAFLTGLVPNASGAAMQLTYTEACHILPFSLTGGVGVPDEKAAVWAALRSFSGYNLLDELNGVAINRLANVITLSPDEHQAFGSLVCWLEAIEVFL
ncbi:hypothetical protein FRC06_007102 [Ceratobasidium sp. 370]|nr:hypothetical protein FRC06_007102 [Ceratobasidium sp. 370]